MAKYNVIDAEEYEGPNIDWNGYQLSMMAESIGNI